MKKIKSIILIASLLTAGALHAQNGLNMPYSQYGVGENQMPFNMPFAQAMGGAIYNMSGSNYVNPFNPASYADVKKESFVFDMGLNIQMSTLKNATDKLYDADGNIGYLAVAFPLTNWWKTSIGLMPGSEMNYASTQLDTTGEVPLKTIYEGVGGVSQAYWGHAFNIGKRLSLGFNMNYTFGSIRRQIAYDFQNGDTSYYVDSYRQKESTIRSLFFDLGLKYRQPLGEKYTLDVALVCKMPKESDVTDNALVATVMGDTIFPLPGQGSTYTSILSQPLTIGAGLALERNEKWQLAADFTHAPWSGLKYTENTEYSLFGRSALAYGENTRLAIGFDYKGNQKASQYVKRIGIRCGFHYEQGKLRMNLNNEDLCLNELGFGAGLSMPMRKGQSVLNLSLHYAHYGQLNPLMRNTFTIGISVGSCESWFVKRRFN